MMDQARIKLCARRAKRHEKDANHANYDEVAGQSISLTARCADVHNGNGVRIPRPMAASARGRIIEDFEREVLGRIPPGVPRVTWTATQPSRILRRAFSPVSVKATGRTRGQFVRARRIGCRHRHARSCYRPNAKGGGPRAGDDDVRKRGIQKPHGRKSWPSRPDLKAALAAIRHHRTAHRRGLGLRPLIDPATTSRITARG